MSNNNICDKGSNELYKKFKGKLMKEIKLWGRYLGSFSNDFVFIRYYIFKLMFVRKFSSYGSICDKIYN